MIVLDTNVISESMKSAAHPAVRNWLNAQMAQTLYLTTVTMAELLFGVSALPAGKRRDRLAQTVEGLVVLFPNRILAFDLDAARAYAELAITARKAGRGFPTPDGYIAAIAFSRGFMVASRDTAPYEAAHIEVTNPWTA